MTPKQRAYYREYNRKWKAEAYAGDPAYRERVRQYDRDRQRLSNPRFGQLDRIARELGRFENPYRREEGSGGPIPVDAFVKAHQC